MSKNKIGCKYTTFYTVINPLDQTCRRMCLNYTLALYWSYKYISQKSLTLKTKLAIILVYTVQTELKNL